MIPPNPSELLAGKRMREFIASAKEDYDIVIVDTPPTGILTDAAIVAGLVDGVIMVVESGKTSKRVLARSYKLMADAKANIFGLVLNKSVIVPTDYYHYYSDAPRLPQDKTGEVLEFLKKELDKFLVKADKALKKAIEDYKNKRQLRRNRKAK
jgi:Mrp family chromosome partitioning ATPase